MASDSCVPGSVFDEWERCKNAASWMETVKKGWWWRRNGWVGIHGAFGLELSPMVDAFFSRQKLLVPYCTIARGAWVCFSGA